MHYGIHGRPHLGAFGVIGDGLRAVGHKVTFQRPDLWRPKDAMTFDRVIIGTLRGVNAAIQQHYSSHGIAVIIAEAPHFRGVSADQTRLSVGAHAWIPSFPCSPYRLRALEVDPRPPQRPKRGGRLLVCGQTDRDSQHGKTGAELAEWLGAAARIVASELGLKPAWRPHPKAEGLPRPDGIGEASGVSLAEDLESAEALLTFNSTAAIEALLAGVPVYCHGPATYEAVAGLVDVGRGTVSAPAVDRAAVVALLARVAYTQWSLEELRAGAWVETIERELACGAAVPLAAAVEDQEPTEPPDPLGALAASGAVFTLSEAAAAAEMPRAKARRRLDGWVDEGRAVLAAPGGRGRFNPRKYRGATPE